MNYKTQVIIGDPKEKICQVVEDLHADLLVIGCRAFGPIKRYYVFPALLCDVIIIVIYTIAYLLIC